MTDDRDRIDDPDAPPSAEELDAATRLRDALDDRVPAHDDAVLARSLSAAWSPRDLRSSAHEELIEKAIGTAPGRRGVVVRVSFGATAALAIAAATLLFIHGAQKTVLMPAGSTAVAFSRSTQSLFPRGFAEIGGERSRIDQIAMARSSDLRDNEFAKWGLR